VVEEANAIGTAYLRIDLLPADAQAETCPQPPNTPSSGTTSHD
jgi:hypothetical protein